MRWNDSNEAKKQNQNTSLLHIGKVPTYKSISMAKECNMQFIWNNKKETLIFKYN